MVSPISFRPIKSYGTKEQSDTLSGTFRVVEVPDAEIPGMLQHSIGRDEIILRIPTEDSNRFLIATVPQNVVEGIIAHASAIENDAQRTAFYRTWVLTNTLNIRRQWIEGGQEDSGGFTLIPSSEVGRSLDQVIPTRVAQPSVVEVQEQPEIDIPTALEEAQRLSTRLAELSRNPHIRTVFGDRFVEDLVNLSRALTGENSIANEIAERQEHGGDPTNRQLRTLSNAIDRAREFESRATTRLERMRQTNEIELREELLTAGRRWTRFGITGSGRGRLGREIRDASNRAAEAIARGEENLDPHIRALRAFNQRAEPLELAMDIREAYGENPIPLGSQRLIRQLEADAAPRTPRRGSEGRLEQGRGLLAELRAPPVEEQPEQAQEPTEVPNAEARQATVEDLERELRGLRSRRGALRRIRVAAESANLADVRRDAGRRLTDIDVQLTSAQTLIDNEESTLDDLIGRVTELHALNESLEQDVLSLDIQLHRHRAEQTRDMLQALTARGQPVVEDVRGSGQDALRGLQAALRLRANNNETLRALREGISAGDTAITRLRRAVSAGVTQAIESADLEELAGLESTADRDTRAINEHMRAMREAATSDNPGVVATLPGLNARLSGRRLLPAITRARTARTRAQELAQQREAANARAATELEGLREQAQQRRSLLQRLRLQWRDQTSTIVPRLNALNEAHEGEDVRQLQTAINAADSFLREQATRIRGELRALSRNDRVNGTDDAVRATELIRDLGSAAGTNLNFETLPGLLTNGQRMISTLNTRIQQPEQAQEPAEQPAPGEPGAPPTQEPAAQALVEPSLVNSYVGGQRTREESILRNGPRSSDFWTDEQIFALRDLRLAEMRRLRGELSRMTDGRARNALTRLDEEIADLIAPTTRNVPIRDHLNRPTGRYRDEEIEPDRRALVRRLPGAAASIIETQGVINQVRGGVPVVRLERGITGSGSGETPYNIRIRGSNTYTHSFSLQFQHPDVDASESLVWFSITVPRSQLRDRSARGARSSGLLRLVHNALQNYATSHGVPATDSVVRDAAFRFERRIYTELVDASRQEQ